MDFELDDRGKSNDAGFIDKKAGSSALRLMYEAEVKVFRAQHGGLENIREKLGFSRRKMCQLLLVDPSAWTRWTRDESKVPPHIYRALEWFLALNQKVFTQPEIAELFHARFQTRQQGSQVDVESTRLEVKELKQKLQIEKDRQKGVFLWLAATIFALALSVGWIALRLP